MPVTYYVSYCFVAADTDEKFQGKDVPVEFPDELPLEEFFDRIKRIVLKAISDIKPLVKDADEVIFKITSLPDVWPYNDPRYFKMSMGFELGKTEITKFFSIA
jgi:hypothetical protein